MYLQAQAWRRKEGRSTATACTLRGRVYVLRTGILWNAFFAGEIWRIGFFGAARSFSGMGEGGAIRGDLAEYDEREEITWE